jgi:formylglycine-generating enzyme required for sulfatase activity
VPTRTWPTVALLLALLAGPAPAQTPLAWRLKEKEQFWTEWNCLQVKHTRLNQQRTAEMEETTVVSRITVLRENPDRSIVVEQQIPFVQSRAVGKPPSPLALRLDGCVVRATLDEKMKITRIDGLEEFVARLARQQGAEATDEQLRAAREPFESQVHIWLEYVFYRLPDRPVRAGETWRQEVNRGTTPGLESRTRTFTFRGTEVVDARQLARIDFTAKTAVLPEEKPGPSLLFQKPHMEVTREDYTGTLYFDPAAGRLAAATEHVHIETEGAGKARGETVEVKSEIQGRSTLRFFDHDPLVIPPSSKPEKAHAEAVAGAGPHKGKERTNSLGMKLVHIPAGKFTMGSPASNPQRTEFEEEHEVEITRPFWMGACEVTVGQFRRFVEETGYKTGAETAEDKGIFGWNAGAGRMEPGKKFAWKNPGWEQTDDHPAVNLSWDDARAFCVWLSKKEGRTYRLPTEAEWEYACRAGTTTRYHGGEDPETLAQTGNAADASAKKKFPQWPAIRGDDGYTFTAPVGRYQPNAFGLYDMHGNALEWCEDWFWYYNRAERTDPKGPAFGLVRVQRGGGWADFPWQCTSARRTGFPPDHCCPSSGFRVVMEDNPGR